jgi:hypothetical protein
MLDSDTIYESALNEAIARGIAHDIDSQLAHGTALLAVAAAAKDEMGSLIRHLHKPEQRFYPVNVDDRSWDTADEAREWGSDDEAIEMFEICSECGRLEAEQLKESGEDWGYRESLWPCPTIKAIR